MGLTEIERQRFHMAANAAQNGQLIAVSTVRKGTDEHVALLVLAVEGDEGTTLYPLAELLPGPTEDLYEPPYTN